MCGSRQEITAIKIPEVFKRKNLMKNHTTPLNLVYGRESKIFFILISGDLSIPNYVQQSTEPKTELLQNEIKKCSIINFNPMPTKQKSATIIFSQQFLKNPLMSCIEIKNLKSLLKQVQKKPDHQRTITNFNQQYYFRTTLKSSDYDVLPLIAEKINRRHKRNGDRQPTKFGNSQLKLFSWMVVLYCHVNNFTLPQLQEQDYHKIQSIFNMVELPRIVYEIKCFCYTKGQIDNEWSQDQIQMLQNLVRQKKAAEWKNIAFEMFKRSKGLYFRFFQQYRQKWINYLNPQLNKGKWTIEDSIKMVSLVISLGRRWAFISRQFQCMRSQHSVKNHFKKLLRDYLGIKDNQTHGYREIDKELLKELMRKHPSVGLDRPVMVEREDSDDDFEDEDEDRDQQMGRKVEVEDENSAREEREVKVVVKKEDEAGLIYKRQGVIEQFMRPLASIQPKIQEKNNNPYIYYSHPILIPSFEYFPHQLYMSQPSFTVKEEQVENYNYEILK